MPKLPNKPLAVLIVEDEPMLRMNNLDMAEAAGLQTYEASNADEAILILERHPEISILFTDIQMPGSMDGLKLSHYARNRWPPLKIIVTSGHLRPQEHELPAGGAFLPKPVTADLFTRKVRELVAG
jgi:CheY-like chemotaxis protein